MCVLGKLVSHELWKRRREISVSIVVNGLKWIRTTDAGIVQVKFLRFVMNENNPGIITEFRVHVTNNIRRHSMQDNCNELQSSVIILADSKGGG